MNIRIRAQFRFLAFLVPVVIGLTIACSQQDSGKAEESETAGISDSSGAVVQMDQRTKDSIAIDRAIRVGLKRWKYRDKAALYDNEFPYLRDEYTFDDYLDLRRVKNAAADSLLGNQILSIQFFRSGDSAYVYQKLWWSGPSGRTHEMGSHERMYKYDGRWIHPMISTVEKQQEYDVLNQWTDSLNN